ncbi:MAG: thioesterase domain-containing protein [Steroidobacteraceae bacterium]
MPLTANGKVDRKAITENLGTDTGQQSQDDTLPVTESQGKVWNAFRDVLEREAFGVQTSFFDLGGHSLAAARLMSRLRNTFGVDLPLRLLFEQPTVAGLACLVDRACNTDESDLDSLPRSVVRLQPGSNPLETPVFALPGHNGDVFCYRHLAEGMTGPLYAVQPPGVDGHALPLSGLEPLTDYLLEQILAIRPEGHCIVMGYCAGGTVATQVARKLEARGQLKALVLIGAQHPRHYQPRARLGMLWRYIASRVQRHARELRKGGAAAAPAYFAARLRNLIHGTRTQSRSTDPLLAARGRVERATLQAVTSYRGGPPLRAPVRLLLPPVLWYRKPDEVLAAWRAEGVDVAAAVCDVSDQGDEMLQSPHVGAVLSRYRDIIGTL